MVHSLESSDVAVAPDAVDRNASDGGQVNRTTDAPRIRTNRFDEVREVSEPRCRG
jgi:hypothetical protein